MFFLLTVIAFTDIVIGVDATETCNSRFDYEYKVVQNLIQLHENQTKVLEILKQQREFIENLSTIVQKNTNKNRRLQQSGSPAGASTYIRWGKTSCPENGTELVYEGYVGGSYYSHSGAAVDYLCLPKDPMWGHYDDELQNGAFVYGAEYELSLRTSSAFFQNQEKSLSNNDVPCAVCKSNRASVLMIPGRNKCHDGWTLEYWGYLTAGYYGNAAATEYACLDAEPEFLVGNNGKQNGILFYFVEGRCGSLKCPPYVNGRELTCALCTK